MEIKIFLFLFCLFVNPSNHATVKIGGLYTMHTSYKDPNDCDSLLIENVILLMVHEYAVKYVNEHIFDKLNITLLSSNQDTCDDTSNTVRRAVHLIGNPVEDGYCLPADARKKHEGSSFESTNIEFPMVALTGSFSGEIGSNINYLFQAFCIPVIASSSSSASLDNYISFPYFIRAGSSDVYRAQVIFDLIQSQEWFHISIIYDSSSFGIALTNQFKTLIEYCSGTNEDSTIFRSPCVEHFYQISFFDNTNSENLNSQLLSLQFGIEKNTVRVFVIFMEGKAINALFNYFSIWQQKPGDFQLILPTTNLELSSYLEYALVVEEKIDPLTNLEDIVYQYTLNGSDTNEWIAEAIMHENLCCVDCNSSTYSIPCNGSERIKNIPDYAKLEARNVFNAINIFASGIRNMYESTCPNGTDACHEYMFTHYTGDMLVKAMINTTFTDERGQEFKLFNRSGTPTYNVFQFYSGNWQTVLYDYNPYKGAYPNLFIQAPIDLPISNSILIESENCQPLCDKSIPDLRDFCCWTCKKCPENFYVNTSLLMCQNCTVGTMPNVYVNGCVPEPTPPLFYDPTPEMYVLMAFNFLGSIISILSGVYLYKLRETAMVKASTPDLCFMQNIAQICLFFISCVMIPSSSIIVCGATWSISTMLLCYTHAIFLIKAIRLSRPMFYIKFHTMLSEKHTPVKTSIIILTVIVFVQFLICVLWLSLRPPTQISTYDRLKYCSSNTEFQTTVLMLIPLVLTFITFIFQRKAGKNRILFQVRQARIGLAGTLCFIVNYAVLLPLMFMEDSPENVRSTILMCIPMLTAWISWVSIHFPVTYETFFRKEQNSHEYVSRERSRQFKDGNVVYYVDAVVLNRARARTKSTVTTLDN